MPAGLLYRRINFLHLKFQDILILLYICSVLVISAMPMGSLISKLIGVFIILYFIIFRIVWHNDKIIINTIILYSFIWFFFCAISGFVSTDYGLYFGKLFTIFQLILFLVIGYSIISYSELSLKYIIFTIFISTLFLFIVGIKVPTSNPYYMTGRMAATTGNANTLASYGAFSLLFSLYLFYTLRNKFFKIILIFAQVFIVYGVLETQSRKGIIVIIFGLIIYLIMNNINKIISKKVKIKSIVSFVIIFFLLIGGIIIGFKKFKESDYYQRFERLANYLQSKRRLSDLTRIIDYSAYERQRFVKYGLNMWEQNPILGVGLDNFRAEINKYWTLSRQTYSHNNYIELLATTGILGFIAFYLIYLTIIYRLFKIRGNLTISSKYYKFTNLFITIMFCRLVQEFALVTYYEKFTWILLLIVMVFIDRFERKTLNEGII